jgi:hypothetical protein
MTDDMICFRRGRNRTRKPRKERSPDAAGPRSKEGCWVLRRIHMGLGRFISKAMKAYRSPKGRTGAQLNR